MEDIEIDIQQFFTQADGEDFLTEIAKRRHPLQCEFGPNSIKGRTKSNRKKLCDLQEKLYADGRRALLVILQGMDTSGKDGTIRNVFSGINPQGIDVHSFKIPTPEEASHDFLWRIHKCVPARGRIAIFNRSHYEEVGVVRVHDLLPEWERPGELADPWERRYERIRNFEFQLAESNTTIVKIFLSITKDEQRQRLEKRIDTPSKRWKFNSGDLQERKLWGKYIKAYAEAIRETDNDIAPWYVIPANDKKFRDLVVSEIVVQTLEKMDPSFPKIKKRAMPKIIQ